MPIVRVSVDLESARVVGGCTSYREERFLLGRQCNAMADLRHLLSIERKTGRLSSFIVPACQTTFKVSESPLTTLHEHAASTNKHSAGDLNPGAHQTST